MLCIRADDCVSIVAPLEMGRGETGFGCAEKEGAGGWGEGHDFYVVI